MVIRKHLTVQVALVAALSIAPVFIGAQPQAPARVAPASGSDPQFKVRLDFNRWHDHAELKSDFQRLEKAWPKFLKYSSLGLSHGKRELMMITVNNPDTGPETEQAGDVYRGQRPRQRDSGRRGRALHGLVSDGELRPHRSDHQARRRARLLRRPHSQPRRPRLTS